MTDRSCTQCTRAAFSTSAHAHDCAVNHNALVEQFGENDALCGCVAAADSMLLPALDLAYVWSEQIRLQLEHACSVHDARRLAAEHVRTEFDVTILLLSAQSDFIGFRASICLHQMHTGMHL